jgi:thiaminase/transcriptional activator TenA
MSGQSFSDELRRRSDDIWQAIHDHPFVTGLGDGSLPRACFRHYLIQDYLYLIDLGRVAALALTKSQQLGDMQRFATVIQSTFELEMVFNEEMRHALQVSVEEINGTGSSLITTAYTASLLRAAYEGTLGDIITAIMPCALGYPETATRLLESGLPDVPQYRAWIETYSSDEIKKSVDWLRQRIDRLAETATETEREHWYRNYLTSARFELLFFHSAWERSLWPEVISW